MKVSNSSSGSGALGAGVTGVAVGLGVARIIGGLEVAGVTVGGLILSNSPFS